jgi:hypothetical protein
MNDATVLIVPGLRDAVASHWQTLLAARLHAQGRPVCEVAPMGRADLDCAARVAAIEAAATAIAGPIVIVAHSGGCVMLAHWARQTRRAVRGALLAVPPDFERPMPAGYPTVAELDDAGWLPLPRQALPFRSIVAASRNDPLADFDRVAGMAQAWGAALVDLGEVGHLNPASGYGDWPGADDFIATLDSAA